MKLVNSTTLFFLGALASFGLFSSDVRADGQNGEAAITLCGVVRDVSDVPIENILVHLTAVDGETVLKRDVRTADDGSFSAEFPAGAVEPSVQTDPAELLERGYFCEPGFIWEPGEFQIIPVLTTVPLSPKLSLARTADGVSCVRLDFDWMDGITPTLLRQYRIEHSTDCRTWTETATVSLACPPMIVFDETQRGEESGYYRVVPVEPVDLATLRPEDRDLIADPAMGWVGDPIIFIDPTRLPEIPVVAPEIFIRPTAAGE